MSAVRESADAGTASLRPSPTTPQLAAIAFDSPSKRSSFRLAIGDHVTPTTNFGTGPASTGDEWVPAGTDRVRVSMTRGSGRFGLALYSPID
ncbi:MAG: hypothetical protein ACR2K3_02380 [Nocardioides sp.]